MKKRELKLSIIIPAYNEEKTISSVIETIPKQFSSIDKVEVIVIDDGSTDKTVEVAQKCGATVFSFKKNQGLAKAILLVLEKYAVGDPINLGTGISTKTIDLINMIFEIAGHQNPEIQFDTSKFVQKIKIVELTKCKEKLGFKPEILLREGLKRSINWYKKNVLAKHNV